uniref:ZP domain-containing protein n=1 Tax=Cyprinus carpio TaxID=7962 RepID=A0A8C1TX19_CYPCA
MLMHLTGEMIHGQTCSTTSSSDPCYNYTILDEYWRDIANYYYSSGNDSLVEWRGWYRLYLGGLSAQMSEWCVSTTHCGGETGLSLNGSHPRLQDGVVTREVVGTNDWVWMWSSSSCGSYKSNSIRVKACPGDYYVYELVKPNASIPRPMYCAVAFQNISSDPCYNYKSLDRPWRANNESGNSICDYSFSWNGWYRLFYRGMNIQLPETCVSSYRCNTQIPLWLNGPHPQTEDGVVIREVCGGTYWTQCCDYKTRPIRVKACPGNYYVYELVRPNSWCAGYCTNISTISQPISTISPAITTRTNNTLNYDPCINYNTLNDSWRNILSYGYIYGSSANYDDTGVNWDGWYRLFLNGLSAQMPEWCVSYLACGGFSSLWLAGSHPRLEDGVVTRDIYGSYFEQCSYYRSDPIQVKACPGNYYVYKFTRPDLSIPSPAYCSVAFQNISSDPCYNYKSLDRPWRANNESGNRICDYSFSWNGWYRLFYRGMNIQLPETCVSSYRCNTQVPLWLNGPHPRTEDGVVIREVCGGTYGTQCCDYKPRPIRVKACPGNYYVYELVRPNSWCAGYCTSTVITITQSLRFTTPSVDPCYNYNSLDETWRATNNSYNSSNIRRDYFQGWYRLFYNGQSAQMPESCVNQYMCGTYYPMWLNGSHPRLEDGVVTRQVCGSGWSGCCTYKSLPIQVKACPGNYYVYEFVRPIFLGAYCADVTRLSAASSTTAATPTAFITPTVTTTGVRDHCSELSCSEDEHCGEKNGVYGCLCNTNHSRWHSESFDFSETCESSSGSMSVSRCQLFEAGFSADILHLNDPSCKGTVRNGRVEFHFDNNEHICGTNLVANGTHFIYDNFILGTPRTEGLISREKILKLSFSCAYPQTQTLSMNVEINPLESIVHKSLPAGEGRYRVRMIPYQDNEFTRPFTGSLDAELNQEMHVEVRVEGVDSRQFALVIDTCWATPVKDPDYSLRWDLIVQECPNPNDDTVELLQNGVSTFSRFSFRMFIFTANSTKLYLHCAVQLCLLSSNHCSVNCNSGQHWRKRRSLDFHDSSSISMGPLMLSEGNTDKWVKDKVKVSKASSLCASLMVLFVFMMSFLILF